MLGFVLINKSEGPTSFDIVRTLRKTLQTRKIGHAGTLDPLATGLLVIAVGKATRLLPLIPVDSKEYIFEIKFGETRDTGDREGRVLEDGFKTPNESDLLSVLESFRGEISQTPPIYSAIKINGKKAYELARKGEDVKMKSRSVTISSLELLSFNESESTAKLVVNCSSGTYVRSLAQDIAESLGSGGFALSIHRTRVGDFHLESAQSMEEFIQSPEVISPDKLLSSWGKVVVSGRDEELLVHGNSINIELADTHRVWVVNDKNELLSLAASKDNILKSIRNLS